MLGLLPQVHGANHSQQGGAISAILGQLLSKSLAGSVGLTLHPAAAGTRFRLLCLALRYARQVTLLCQAQQLVPFVLHGNGPGSRGHPGYPTHNKVGSA